MRTPVKKEHSTQSGQKRQPDQSSLVENLLNIDKSQSQQWKEKWDKKSRFVDLGNSSSSEDDDGEHFSVTPGNNQLPLPLPHLNGRVNGHAKSVPVTQQDKSEKPDKPVKPAKLEEDVLSNEQHAESLFSFNFLNDDASAQQNKLQNMPPNAMAPLPQPTVSSVEQAFGPLTSIFPTNKPDETFGYQPATVVPMGVPKPLQFTMLGPQQQMVVQPPPLTQNWQITPADQHHNYPLQSQMNGQPPMQNGHYKSGI